MKLRTKFGRVLTVLMGAALFIGPAHANTPQSPSTVSVKDCALLSEINYQDQNEVIARLRHLYQASNFAELDATLACLLNDPKKFQSGKPGASAVYWFFRREMPAPGVEDAQAARVKAWQKQKPDSVFAAFAELRLMYALAWNVRGSDYAKDTPGGSMQAFQQGLLQSEKLLLDARQDYRHTPIWQNLLLAVSLDAQHPQSDPGAVFKEGVSRWPNYYDFHELILTRLVPRWGGSWETADAFIVGWTRQLQTSEGESLYARLYASLILGGADPRETRLDWPRMKRSLDELIKRYPDPVHKNWAATLACVHGDPAYYKLAMQRIGPQDLRPAAWVAGTAPATCLR